jgi:hypothetical protein
MIWSLARVERSRLEARERMARSSDVRLIVRKQIYIIFIDFVLIIATLLVIDLLTSIKDYLHTASGSESITSLVLLAMALSIIVPAMIHLVKRISVIAITLAMSSKSEGKHSLAGMLRTYRLFMNMGSAISFVLLILLIFPLLPDFHGLPISSFELVVAVIVVSWLAWDVIDRRYDRVAASLSKSLEIGKEESQNE